MIKQNEREYVRIVCELLKSNDYLKVYKKYIQKLSTIDNMNEIVIVKNIADLYTNQNGFSRIYHLENINDFQQIIEWIKKIRGTKSCEKKLEIFDVRKYLLKEEICRLLKQVENELKNIELKVVYESYEEDIIFANGIVEMRGFQSALFKILYEEIEVDHLVYSKMPNKEELISEIQKKIISYREWDKFKKMKWVFDENQKIECIVSPKVAGQLFHESIGHYAEADVYEQLLDCDIQIENKVSKSELYITDYPNLNEIRTGIVFDEEGTVAKPVQIVKAGTFQKIMSVKEWLYSGNEYKLAGFSRSSIDNNIPQIRMRNLVVKNGFDKQEEFISNLKEGIYIIESDNAKREKEKIYLHIKKALIVKDGKFIGKVEDIWLWNENREFLQSIFAIFDNGKWSELLTCRKNGGSIYISSYSPGIACTLRKVKTF